MDPAIFHWQLRKVCPTNWLSVGITALRAIQKLGSDRSLGPIGNRAANVKATKNPTIQLWQRHTAHINYTRFVRSYLRPYAAEIRILLNAMPIAQ